MSFQINLHIQPSLRSIFFWIQQREFSPTQHPFWLCSLYDCTLRKSKCKIILKFLRKRNHKRWIRTVCKRLAEVYVFVRWRDKDQKVGFVRMNSYNTSHSQSIIASNRYDNDKFLIGLETHRITDSDSEITVRRIKTPKEGDERYCLLNVTKRLLNIKLIRK